MTKSVQEPTEEAAPVEELAVMSDVKFGVGDRGRVWLQFNAHMLHASTFLILEIPEAVKAIEAASVSDVQRLNGRVCVVETKDFMSKFVRMFDQ